MALLPLILFVVIVLVFVVVILIFVVLVFVVIIFVFVVIILIFVVIFVFVVVILVFVVIFVLVVIIFVVFVVVILIFVVVIFVVVIVVFVFVPVLTGFLSLITFLIAFVFVVIVIIVVVIGVFVPVFLSPFVVSLAFIIIIAVAFGALSRPTSSFSFSTFCSVLAIHMPSLRSFSSGSLSLLKSFSFLGFGPPSAHLTLLGYFSFFAFRELSSFATFPFTLSFSLQSFAQCHRQSFVPDVEFVQGLFYLLDAFHKPFKLMYHPLQMFTNGLLQFVFPALEMMRQTFLQLCLKIVKLHLNLLQRLWRSHHTRVTLRLVHPRVPHRQLHVRRTVRRPLSRRMLWWFRMSLGQRTGIGMRAAWPVFGTWLLGVTLGTWFFHFGMLKFMFERACKLFGMCPELFGLFHPAFFLGLCSHFFEVNNFFLELGPLYFFSLACMGLHLLSNLLYLLDEQVGPIMLALSFGFFGCFFKLGNLSVHLFHACLHLLMLALWFIPLRPTFFSSALYLNSLEPFLPFFYNTGSFYFVSFFQLACGVHKVLIARYEDGDMVVALKGFEDDSQISALADLALGVLYKDTADLYISVAFLGLQ
jgi:20S proteasome subunit beta 7